MKIQALMNTDQIKTMVNNAASQIQIFGEKCISPFLAATFFFNQMMNT